MLFRKVDQQDLIQVDHIFRTSITDLVIRELIDEPGLIDREVAQLNRTVQDSLNSKENLFFVTEIDHRIVGTIALINPNLLICENVQTEPNVYEIGCVYVHPDYQKQGIGKFMFHSIKEELIRIGHEKYYLDAGFTSSQQYWFRVLGKPTYVLENHWGTGAHHFIWSKSIHSYFGTDHT